MTNERNQGIPGHAGRHAGAPAQGNNPRARAAAPQPGHAQKASMTSQLSQALPMLEVDEMAAPMGAPVITFDHVTKTYPAQPKKPALSDVTLQIFAGEFIFLVGHSGSGKSTFIRLLTREIKPTSGKIYVADEDLTTMRNWRVPYLRRNIGCVFQDFKLLPNKTVFENVAFALEVIGKSRHVIKTQVPEVLRLVGLSDKLNSYPDQLSGGQQQRVAIARSLVNQPRVLLLDEPLGALDLKLRKEMQLELKRLQREMNITFVYVTHDQEEALTMSDTVVVMSGGKIQQIGSPQDIYNEPKNAFVARFIGDSNIVDGVMLRDFYVNFGGHDFTCVDRGFKPNEPVQVVIRPEDVQIVPPSVGMLTGLVREVIFKGVHFEMHVDVEGYEWIIHSTQASQPGELIGMNIGPDEIHIMKRSEV